MGESRAILHATRVSKLGVLTFGLSNAISVNNNSVGPFHSDMYVV